MQFFCQHVKQLRLFVHKIQWFKIIWNCLTHSYSFLLFPHIAIAILHKFWAQLRQAFQQSSDSLYSEPFEVFILHGEVKHEVANVDGFRNKGS